MDQQLAARAALARAMQDVELAIGRVRHAQQVDWVSVFASRYREELYAVIRELVRLRDELDDARVGMP